MEGSEEFVEKHWPEVLELIQNNSQSITGMDDSQKELIKQKTKKSGKKIIKKEKGKISTTPIAIDLSKNGDKPSLKEFYELKSPKTDPERLTLFAYYMKKFLKTDDMEPGHAMFCYGSVNQKKPTNILSAMTNVINRKGWVEIGRTPYTLTTTIGGDNYVEFEMDDNVKQESEKSKK